jgi:hypothetical protein
MAMRGRYVRIDRNRKSDAALGLFERPSLERDDPKQIMRAEMLRSALEGSPAGTLGFGQITTAVMLGGLGELGIWL